MSVASLELVVKKFEETLRTYANVSTRTWRQIVDTKAWYVARKALWFTMKADAYTMRTTLGGMVKVSRLNKKGKLVGRRVAQLVKSEQSEAPLAVAIIAARLRESGQPSPFKGVSHGAGVRKMFRLVRDFLVSRARSIAFLKSGWLDSIKGLAPFADRRDSAPPTDASAKQYGRAKGTWRRYGGATTPTTEIVNLATTRRDHNGALVKYATGGLEEAFADERGSMNDYIEKKMKPDAAAFNRQQH